MKLAVDHRPAAKVNSLVSALHREAEVSLLKPSTTYKSCRIVVMLRFNGEWREKNDGEGEPIVTFSGVYEGRFIFSEEVELADVSKWLESKFYRESIIAQAFPIASSHMLNQLEMTGINTKSRRLGFDPDHSTESSRPQPVAKRAKKP